MANILALVAIVSLVGTLLQHFPMCATNTMPDQCGTGWQNRSDKNGAVVCYWFEWPLASRPNVSWRDALWSCRDMGAELFEPADVEEMRWVEEKLMDGMYNGTEWHVYGHRYLYGNDAWHSGQLLDGSFDNRLVPPNVEREWCFQSIFLYKVSYECALLRHSNRRLFELSFSECLHVERTIGFICRRELRISSQSFLNAPQDLIRCKREWVVYENTQTLSWFEAQQKCNQNGGELPRIESAVEFHSMVEQMLKRSSITISDFYFTKIVYLNLHKWLYNSSGWAWSSGKELNISVLDWDTGIRNSRDTNDACDNMDSCAYLMFVAGINKIWSKTLSNNFCHSRKEVTLVCERPNASCLLHSPKRTTTNVTADRSGKTNGEPTGRIELKWVLMVIGAVLGSSLVLLVAALIAGFTLSRLSRMQRSIAKLNSTHPQNAFSVVSSNYWLQRPIPLQTGRAFKRQLQLDQLTSISSDHYYDTVQLRNQIAPIYETVEVNLEKKTEGVYDQIVESNKKFEGDEDQ